MMNNKGNVKKMKRDRTALYAIIIFFLSAFLFSCASSTSRRAALIITPYTQRLSVSGLEEITLLFNEVIPGKPLNETVWDNVAGPFWDVKESGQIGFTQEVSRSWPVSFSVGVMGGSGGVTSTGGGIGVSTEQKPPKTKNRMVIPFGNIFSRTVESAVKNNIKYSTACYKPSCVSLSFSRNVLRIAITNVSVWEEPSNHLNMTVHGKSTFLKNGTVVKEYEFDKAALSQFLGPAASSPNTFIDELNRTATMLAQEATTDIINNTIK